jgi:ATP-binding cassette subfamily B protein
VVSGAAERGALPGSDILVLGTGVSGARSLAALPPGAQQRGQQPARSLAARGIGIARERAAPPARAGGTLETRDLAIRPGQHGAPVCAQQLNLVIRAGEQVLLEGASGAGKSTLAHVLAGLRRPDRGLLLLDGLDHATLGSAAWSRRVALAPQFHEDHVFAASLAFNVLLGLRWPPSRADIAEAEAICRDLGLGPLLQRMPAGLLQTVGETGWQLSHGERSRLFAARAILAGSALVILDESMAALDA